MKTIKFRAWEKPDKTVKFEGKMHYEVEKADYLHKWLQDNNYEIMLWTGLLDRLRKEIFEGDIIKVKMYSGKFENYKVIWDKKEACWDSINKKRDNWISPTVWKKSKVIGNIYEGIKI